MFENGDIYMGKNRYIIAPDLSRSTVHAIIGKGFTHFKRIAGIEEQKCFKELRKTFMNRFQTEYGDTEFTSLVSDHSSMEVVKKHYLSSLAAAKKMKDFKIFGS